MGIVEAGRDGEKKKRMVMEKEGTSEGEEARMMKEEVWHEGGLVRGVKGGGRDVGELHA